MRFHELQVLVLLQIVHLILITDHRVSRSRELVAGVSSIKHSVY